MLPLLSLCRSSSARERIVVLDWAGVDVLLVLRPMEVESMDVGRTMCDGVRVSLYE